jgi:hypothetical protein
MSSAANDDVRALRPSRGSSSVHPGQNPGVVALGLGAVWLAVQVGLLFFGPRSSNITSHFIIRHGNDSWRYLDAARGLLQAKLPGREPLRSLGYDIFLAFFLWSGIGELGAVLAQAALTALAAFCLYRIARRLYDHRTGLLATLLYIVYADIHRWNSYILTESLFISMIIISLFLVIEWRGWGLAVVTGLVVLFTSIVRPNGIILIGSIGIYALYSLWRAGRHKSVAVAAVVMAVAAPLAIYIIGWMMLGYPILDLYREGNVIGGPQPVTVTTPGGLPTPPQGIENPLLQYLWLIGQEPGYFLRLAGMRLWYLFIHARPYYSFSHNVFVLLTLVPVYVLAVWGLVSRTDYPAEKVLLVSIFCMQTFLVALNRASVDGRHLLVLLPIVFLFASRGAWRLKEMALRPS